ncbi:unnamed protein product [Cyclocybe aegerita]|uniref:F-box domain-containing protein n=1 Tax=Cyclocybe aegerita TaxID=1973307 RepID=A0A8S0XSU2_CYCAE|nr:unnamed protein product [Cyclocybe aegerita]
MCLCTVCGRDGTTRYPAVPPKGSLSCYSCLELKNLEAQIADTKAFLNHLEAHLSLLKSNHNHTHGYFTHRLPPEVASNIFVLAVSGPETSRSEHLSPLTLGAVSRRWRQIAWSTPRLWTYVPVRLNRFEVSFHLPKELLLQWIGRTGQLPLSICMLYNEADADPTQHTENFTNVIEIINEYSLRWETLNIMMPFSLYPRLRSKCDKVPLLKHLIMRLPLRIDDDALLYKGEILDVCTVPPLPQTVMIEGFPLASIRIDWSNVTTLQLADSSVIDCQRLFQQAPQLSQCSIDIIGGVNALRLDSSIVLPCLTKLNISLFIGEATAKDLLDSITLPALKDLEYHFYSIDNMALAALLNRSSCPLASLHLKCWLDRMPLGQSLLQTLRASPSLENLCLDLIPLPQDFFESLSDPPSDSVSNQGILLPRLQSFSYSGELTFDWSSFVKCIDSRLTIRGDDGGPLLRSIDLCSQTIIRQESNLTSYYISELATADLCRLLKSGISIKIANGPWDMLQYSMSFHKKSWLKKR